LSVKKEQDDAMQHDSETQPIGRKPFKANKRDSLHHDGINALTVPPVQTYTQPLVADAKSRRHAAAPKVIVSSSLTSIDWDLAIVITRKLEGLLGSGSHTPHHYYCQGESTEKTEDGTQYSKMCSDKSPSGATYGADFDSGGPSQGTPRNPSFSLSYSDSLHQWVIQSVTAYSVIRVSDPASDDAYPVLGKNVTINPSDGIRGTPPSEDPDKKGYYQDVANNLRRYKSAEEKNTGMYWWLPGVTLRHERKHFEFYKNWLDRNCAALLQLTATELGRQLEQGEVSADGDLLARKAQGFFGDLIEKSKSDDFSTESEKYASGASALEFQMKASEIERQGKELERKSKATQPDAGAKN
jgi:hypothetical protein